MMKCAAELVFENSPREFPRSLPACKKKNANLGIGPVPSMRT